MKRTALASIAPPVAAAPPGSRAASRPDLDLFVDQVGWLGAHLRDRSRLSVMSWIGRALRPEVCDELRSFFRVDHQIHIQAERELLALLRRPWQKQAPRYSRLDMPERNVDWTRTHVEELTSPPSRFWARDVVPMLDAGLLGGLCSLGRTMLDLGTLGPLSEERRAVREALRDAMAQVARTIGRRHGAYTHLHEQRLLRMDRETRSSAQALRAYLAFWQDRFGAEGDTERLRAFAKEIEEADLRCQRRTLDSLLELSVSIAIARAAQETQDTVDLPEGVRWELEDVDERDERNVPRILLRAGALSCTISKNAPKGDALVPLLADMGIEARGNQPDIVLTFAQKHADGHEDRLVVLADAKRNAEHDGRGYLATSVETAAVYAVSFGHLMGVRFHPDGHGRIDGDVLPAVSLFCRQGVKKVAGAGPRQEDIVARLRAPQRLPAVMALDFQHFFGGEGGTRWSPAIVGAWFGRIAREASAAFRHRAAEHRSQSGGGQERGSQAARTAPAGRRERVRRDDGGDAA
ncbi:hypothetical protein [Polyangium fumosum]|uniref:Uncharacterized protein n=1 Tax=Polyangium fumosum TaxID=889272 RepID=A0A4U1IX80_9BACT|nr:hypothetical protein [Polyangium fumosum]TKC99108.1 hypothetical protein E8A74_38895 [Polyangium fumosum]